jgi:large subunit ribosomal protein L22
MDTMTQSYSAKLSGIRIGARKVRLVVDLVRGKQVQDALDTVRFLNKRGAPVVFKLISSAIANAKETASVDVDNLVVSEAYVDEGPMLRRFIPRAKGSASGIRKKSSHITIKLREV